MTLDSNPICPAFAQLQLGSEILQAILESGYSEPTEIQSAIIPEVLQGRDVLAQSQTGTGKTAAFALPLLEKLDCSKRVPQVLVLAPTRELAIQVAKAFEKYGARLADLSVVSIYGGQDYEIQFKQLKRGPQVVVGTPGRVIDHINRGTLDLSQVESLVLDEADEMLNMGFLEDVKFVLQQLPERRQIALFSATLPPPIRAIANDYLHQPARIAIEKKTMTVEAVRQRAIFAEAREKLDVLTRVLEVEPTDGVIVFTKTREASVQVADRLAHLGYSAIALNGEMPQRTRERTIEKFKAGSLDILVATDVAARGLDVQRVSHVINFDLAQDTESYVHRIGRTGRAGRKGEALILLSKSHKGKLRLIEKATRQSIEIVQPPTLDEVNRRRVEQYKAALQQVVAQENLVFFEQLAEQLSSETELPLSKIAAAMAWIGQRERPLLLTKPTKSAGESWTPSDSEGSREGRRRTRTASADEGSYRKRERSEKGSPHAARKSKPLEAGMDRYRIEVGRVDGVRPGNIVGAIANESGIDGSSIGAIALFDTYSTIDLPVGMPDEVRQLLQTTRVAGKPLKIRRVGAKDGPNDTDGDSRADKRRSKFKPFGKSEKARAKNGRKFVGGDKKFSKRKRRQKSVS